MWRRDGGQRERGGCSSRAAIKRVYDGECAEFSLLSRNALAQATREPSRCHTAWKRLVLVSINRQALIRKLACMDEPTAPILRTVPPVATAKWGALVVAAARIRSFIPKPLGVQRYGE